MCLLENLKHHRHPRSRMLLPGYTRFGVGGQFQIAVKLEFLGLGFRDFEALSPKP